MRLELEKSQYNVNTELLERVAKAAFSLYPEIDGEVDLGIVNEKLIRELNQKYRNIDSVTDTLSFKISEKPFIGQIFVCYNKAKAQASEFEKSIDAELSLLVAHGILHLYGMDHVTQEEAESMEQKEKLILSNVGLDR